MISKHLYYPHETEMNCSSYEKKMCLNSFLGIIQVTEGVIGVFFRTGFAQSALRFHFTIKTIVAQK